ncbi:hypothetical protein TNCV_663291 [Trichonephila clavipes]|nr:hypothetical protein TNCV_663291 [Trichonephila clavipes]
MARSRVENREGSLGYPGVVTPVFTKVEDDGRVFNGLVGNGNLSVRDTSLDKNDRTSSSMRETVRAIKGVIRNCHMVAGSKLGFLDKEDIRVPILYVIFQFLDTSSLGLAVP